MSILQEYKFYLVIVILALVATLAVFTTTSQSRAYTTFEVDTQSDYATVKATATETTVLGQAITTPESLFGKVINDEVYYFDEADKLTRSTRLPITGIETGTASLSYIIPGSSDNIESLSGDGVGINKLDEIDPSWTSAERGFSLDTGGYIAISFENNDEAIDAYSKIGKGELINNSLFIPFQKQGEVLAGGEDGSLLYDLSTNLTYTNIIGINVLDNSIPVDLTNNRLYLLQNGILHRYFNGEIDVLGSFAYSAAKGMSVSTNNSFGILSDNAGNVYKKFFSSPAEGSILFTDVNLQSLDLYNNDEIYYTSGTTLYKRTLDDINTEITVKTGVSTYFDIQGTSLLYTQGNNLFKSDLNGVSDIQINTSNITLWAANETHVYYQTAGGIIKHNLLTGVEETISATASSLKANPNGVIYDTGAEVTNETSIIPIEGELTSYTIDDAIIYIKDANTYLYDIENPEGYKFDPVVWTTRVDIPGQTSIKINLENE